MNELLDWDRRLLLWLNGFHTPWLDTVMMIMTKTSFSIPLYLFFAFLIFRYYGRDGWFILAGIGLAILLSDQSTGLMKYYFVRPRPSHEPSLENLLHIVNGYKGGLYGFASAHAANSFAIATVLWLAFRRAYRWTVLLFVWAAILSYTRIYLGVHYPGDVAVGAVLGIFYGFLGFLFFRWLQANWGKDKAHPRV
jgi:undecaprenyl-diphosphatase